MKRAVQPTLEQEEMKGQVSQLASQPVSQSVSQSVNQSVTSSADDHPPTKTSTPQVTRFQLNTRKPEKGGSNL